MILKILISIPLVVGIFGTLIGVYNLVTYYDEPLGLFFLLATAIFVKLLLGEWSEKENYGGE